MKMGRIVFPMATIIPQEVTSSSLSADTIWPTYFFHKIFGSIEDRSITSLVKTYYTISSKVVYF